jgi:hypothetical protein
LGNAGQIAGEQSRTCGGTERLHKASYAVGRTDVPTKSSQETWICLTVLDGG